MKDFNENGSPHPIIGLTRAPDIKSSIYRYGLRSDDQATIRSSDSDFLCRVKQVEIIRLRYRKGSATHLQTVKSSSHQNSRIRHR
jgi:hypothetical protein